jgi:hypothetical protein
MAEPWARLADETDEQYGHFLFFRNCGFRRSLRKAYCQYLKQEDGYTGVPKGLHVPPDWLRASQKHDWRNRARAWDIRNLSAHGGRLAVLHTESLVQIAKKNYRAAKEMSPGDDGWADLVAGLKLVGEYLTPDVLSGIQDRVCGPVPVPTTDRAAVE